MKGTNVSVEAAFTTFPIFTTERLRLRRLRAEDVKDVYAILSDEEVMRYLGMERHQSLEESRLNIEQAHARYARREAIRWAVTLKGEDRVLGSCSLHHFGPGYRRAEVGYDLHRAYWGKGIMSEAVSAILAYAFTDLNLHRVEAIIDIANEASKNLLLKLGFSYEGNLRQRYPFRDRFDDEHYFGLLKHEWRGGI